MEGNIRKLASIKRIDEIIPIENADKIEIARIGGWQVIVKKGEFKPQDLAVYCEIDSLLPEKPEFEFLRPKHFRIKTIKMRGVISQGIVFPLSILGDINKIEEIYSTNGNKATLNDLEGKEVTEYLGITKYEPPISPQLMGMAKGNFPTDIVSKTDEERLQSSMKVLNEIYGKQCYITIKEDGTSFTAFNTIDQADFSDSSNPKIFLRFGVCSRNLELKEESFPGSDMNIYWKVANKYDIKEKLRQYYVNTGRCISIQGEITGDGIQNNRLGLARNEFQLHLFNIYDIGKKQYVNLDEFISIAKILDIPTVEIIYKGIFNFTLEQLLEMAKGKYSGTNNNREGIVIRPAVEEFSKTLQSRLSFKVINNDYLLKEEN